MLTTYGTELHDKCISSYIINIQDLILFGKQHEYSLTSIYT